jgi:hypothetical protein
MFTTYPARLNQERKEFALTIKATSSRTTIFHLSTVTPAQITRTASARH